MPEVGQLVDGPTPPTLTSLGVGASPSSHSKQHGSSANATCATLPAASAAQPKSTKDHNIVNCQPRRSSAPGCDPLTRYVLDISGAATDGAQALVDDSFNKCFTSTRPQSAWTDASWRTGWLPVIIVDVVLRYLVLFPLSVALLVVIFGGLACLFLLLDALCPKGRATERVKRRMACWMGCAWVLAWHGVIRWHGPRPVPGPNRIWVSNHTSIIDYALLCSISPFAVIMQLQHGWVALLQQRICGALGGLSFHRTEANDRAVIAERMRAHVARADGTPLLVFPEGTCVNNEYTVMFKRGAFDIGATVCPIAVRYNKFFVDPFWNSRRESPTKHIFRLLTGWALVCDVYFLEPQDIRPGESPQEFAARVQALIARYAGLRVMPWDGYLKYYNLADKSPKLVAQRQAAFAEGLGRVRQGEGARQ